jgi:hypothetical protein
MSDLAYTLTLSTALILGSVAILAWAIARNRRPAEPLALGKVVKFTGTRSDGRPQRFVPTEFTWENGATRIVFQDEASYKASRKVW